MDLQSAFRKWSPGVSSYNLKRYYSIIAAVGVLVGSGQVVEMLFVATMRGLQSSVVHLAAYGVILQSESVKSIAHVGS